MAQGIVIIPTFNEIENIEAIVKAVFALPTPFHVLIVDDNSPDGTAAKVEELQKEFPTQLHLKVRMEYRDWETDRKSTRLNSSHSGESRMPSSA